MRTLKFKSHLNFKSTSHFKHYLAGTAIALILTIGPHPAFAMDQKAIEAAIPVPEPANVSPPTAADVLTSQLAKPDASKLDASKPDASKPDASKLDAGKLDTKAAAPLEATPAAPIVVPAATASPAGAEKPALASTAPTADQAITEKLHELANGKFDRILGSKKERSAVDAFYSARGYAPLWIADGAANERAKAAIAHLRGVEADGLDPGDYPTPDFKAAEPGALAEAEIRLTASVLDYVRHAELGRVHFSRISADIYYSREATEPGEVLAKIASAKDVDQGLESFNPQQKGYLALKAKLAEVRAGKGEAAPVRVGSGPLLKVGKVLMQDPRVPLLRERLGVADAAGDTTYDKALAQAVAKFQREHELSPSGNLNAATIDALNGPRHDHEADTIIANMERWRWLPRHLGNAYVMLNIPDYTLKVVRDGATLWQTRVVVGKPSTATPLLSETMKYITINPTWNVPPSIVYNEYLPALQQDPTALERLGLKLVQNPDGSVHISQPPGERNALGRVRFNFPNKFLVYQHDTPDKYLFAKDERAFSHGCMRVQDPVKYAEVLLSIALPHEGWTEERIKRMFGSAEYDIKFPTPIPVHITYQTAYVDDGGKLVIRKDIYGRDTRMLAALRGDERKLAEVAVEHPQPNYSSRPAVRLPESYSYAGSNGGGSFFERLFGGPPPGPPVPARRIFTR